MKIKFIPAILIALYILNGPGWAQNGLPQSAFPAQNSGKQYHVTVTPESGSFGLLPDLAEDSLVLTPELTKASLNQGQVTIPFTVKNNSNRDIEFKLRMNQIAGLATVNQDGKKRLIAGGEEAETYSGPGPDWIKLKPGETSSFGLSIDSMETLGTVTDQAVFGVVRWRFPGTNKSFLSYSAPFLVPPALTTLPYNDLGAQNYLSVTPDLTKVGFTGGDFKVTTLELQRADPHYADSIKNEWAQDVWIPITVANASNQDLIAANDEIRFYIAGDENGKNSRLRDERWEYLKTATPILKPGESCESTGRDYITLRFLEDEGYKPGDKIIAMVGGRIPGTNNIFECYSAPFELPPLPKGEPPAAADNVNGTSTIPSADKTSGNKENSAASTQSQSSTTLAAQSAKQPAPQPPIEPVERPQRANGIWYIAGAALLAALTVFFIKRSRTEPPSQNQ